MIKAPCKGCTERYSACHDDCDRYKAFQAECLKSNEYNREKNAILISEHGRRNIWRNMRGKPGRHRKSDKYKEE